MKYPVTAKQRALFTASVEKWASALNLRDWRISVIKQPAHRGAMADVSCDIEARMATVRLATDLGREVSDAELDAIALHEVMHIFLAEMLALARDPGASEAHRMSIEHRVINTVTLMLTGRN